MSHPITICDTAVAIGLAGMALGLIAVVFSVVALIGMRSRR